MTTYGDSWLVFAVWGPLCFLLGWVWGYICGKAFAIAEHIILIDAAIAAAEGEKK